MGRSVSAASTRDQHPNRLKAQRGFFKHRQTLFALSAQGDQFAVTHGRVDRLQGGQTGQLFFGVGCQTALCFCHAFSVLRRDFLLACVDPRGQLITLRLDELVGAGAGHTFKLIVQGIERDTARQIVAIGVEQAAQRSRRQVASQLQ